MGTDPFLLGFDFASKTTKRPQALRACGRQKRTNFIKIAVQRRQL
jgi:hypothetical protein